MHSTKTWLRRGALALACCLGLSEAASAGTVVISASGPSARSYPAGRSLAAGSRIVLAPGDTLTVLDSRGTRTLRGPVTASAEASATTSNASFAALVATQNRRRARTGAIRGVAGAIARPDNMWYVNVAGEGGTFCVMDPAAVQLWRPDMQASATLAVSEEGGRSGSATFPLGQNTTAWPATLPIADGRSYTLSGQGLSPRRVRFAVIDTAISDPASAYMALDAKGCAAQKQVLLGSLPAGR